jgi:hypothetical protein
MDDEWYMACSLMRSEASRLEQYVRELQSLTVRCGVVPAGGGAACGGDAGGAGRPGVCGHELQASAQRQGAPALTASPLTHKPLSRATNRSYSFDRCSR